ncbi:MAG: transporter substrate-binding domain-containing protein [gamma proteobacterium symbiont of Taylorina sp.]|nr:transporter substrate-binding domain-containing protein [gamma proteobacterium symbiont of Taylorina sp.]
MKPTSNLLIKTITFSLFSLNSFASEDILEIVYEPREPYVIEAQNSITGLVASPLIEALDNSKINYQLKNKPSKRHLLEIKANKKALCAVGWFKNPEREQFAKYSNPLYQDKSMGIIALKKTEITEGISIDNLLKKNRISILVKDSYSYGNFLDTKLSNSNVKKTKATNKNMLSMIAKKRADFMFISYEEAIELLAVHKYKDRLKFIVISNMPQGNNRYLICSKRVDSEIIINLNEYIN